MQILKSVKVCPNQDLGVSQGNWERSFPVMGKILLMPGIVGVGLQRARYSAMAEEITRPSGNHTFPLEVLLLNLLRKIYQYFPVLYKTQENWI